MNQFTEKIRIYSAFMGFKKKKNFFSKVLNMPFHDYVIDRKPKFF